MTTHHNVGPVSRRALGAALAVVVIAVIGTARAQISIDVPQAGDPKTARTAAERELESARAAVLKARATAVAAKRELEAAVAASTSAAAAPASESQQAGREAGVRGESADRSPGTRSWASTLAQAKSSEIDALHRLIADLKAERSQLLEHLMPRHPLIIDADVRIEEYEKQLTELAAAGAPGKAVEGPRSNKLVVPAAPGTTGAGADTTSGRQEAALALDEALAKWEKAQRMLETAMEHQSSAAQQLAAIASQAPVAEPAVVVATSESKPAMPSQPVSESNGTLSREPSASHPLVLVALIVALVVAAVASVKLARASDSSVFAGPDDAAATLSLPVVGVIPATSHAVVHSSFFQRYRAVTFLLQMLLAVMVFAVVAYVVQSPALRF